MKNVLNYFKDYGGIGLGCAVFAVLLILKLTDVICWSWWYVIAPLWVPIVIDVLLSVVYVAYQFYLNGEDCKDEEE